MKTKVAVAEWNNATDALKDATTLAIHGQHKGAESRAYFAIEHGARAALATRNQEPKTHTAVGRAFVRGDRRGAEDSPMRHSLTRESGIGARQMSRAHVVRTIGGASWR